MQGKENMWIQYLSPKFVEKFLCRTCTICAASLMLAEDKHCCNDFDTTAGIFHLTTILSFIRVLQCLSTG